MTFIHSLFSLCRGLLTRAIITIRVCVVVIAVGVLVSGFGLSIWLVFKLLAHGIPFVMWVQQKSVGIALVAKIEIPAISALVAEAADFL
jgi:hypothetical protein